MALSILPALAALASCSGGGATNWGGDDSGTSDDDGGTTPTDDSGSTPPPGTPLATGLSITGITVDQAVEVNVVKNGAMATKNAPIIAGRAGVVRVFVSPSSSFSPHSISGVLTLHTAGQDHTFTASLAPKSASSDAAVSSTFNFNVDATSLGTDTTLLVQLKDPAGTGAGDTSAQFPTNGKATSLGVEASGVVKITVIPIRFTSGGATAATGANDIYAYRSLIMSMYPATDVELTVGSTYSYSGAIPDAYDQTGAWDALLSAIQQKRAADPTPDVYYYGAFAPTSSLTSYCSNGCIAGLSTIPNSAADYTQKASIGLVYGGDSISQQQTGQTMAHEVGHGHGRAHSPTTNAIEGCTSPNAVDPGYPYTNGGIGVWGYNTSGASPMDPSKYYDIMGYCAFDWISDYTYGALYKWIAADNGADFIPPSKPVTYREIFVRGDGSLSVGEAFPVYGPVSGEPHSVTFEVEGATRTATGYFRPYDHVPGGTILVQEPPSRFTSLRVADYGRIAIKLAP